MLTQMSNAYLKSADSNSVIFTGLIHKVSCEWNRR